MIFGRINSNGEVESVVVGDRKKFSDEDEFNPKDKVVVSYHTWKKDKSK